VAGLITGYSAEIIDMLPDATMVVDTYSLDGELAGATRDHPRHHRARGAA
jgi:hypothetical protein